MLGLCYLARKLAIQRVGYSPFGWNGGSEPLERDFVMRHVDGYRASAEYYRIFERIEQGAQP